MRRYIKPAIVFWMICFILHINNVKVWAQDSAAEKYERDYLSNVYDSENGLEGTTANCVCADAEGFLWFGSYTGLYRYDGTKFKKYLLEDDRALPVNDLVQDRNGNLWIGTNGDGVYCFDGKTFTEYQLNDDVQGTSVVNRLYLDSEGTVWAGTNAGLFSIHLKEKNYVVKEYKKFSDEIIQDIGELASGKKIIIQKTGEVFFLQDEMTERLVLTESDGVPRCCYVSDNNTFYIGTSGRSVLKVTDHGDVLCEINGNGLSSFNKIYDLNEEECWVCSDTGIGILKEDRILQLEFPLDDSVEEGCEDYQGNYWFVSSRQGIMQLYENYFSDLGEYWGIDQTVNAIQPYKNKIYVGCDNGLFCFKGKERQNDQLVRSCKGQRIRQVYLDNEENLWVSTHRDGIKKMDLAGNITCYNTKSSEMETDKIRCIWQKEDDRIFVGTEDGLFLIGSDDKIQRYTDNSILNTKRILDVKESDTGKVFASTDGYGVYEMEDGVVTNIFSKKQGLLSNVVMKIVPSKAMKGVWAVTGEGICFISEDGTVRKAAGISAANSLDLLLTEEGEAVILAGNGLFRLREKDLLEKNNSCIYLNKQDGLPVDFTANARNSIQNGILYMCGTTGAASMDLNKEQTEKPIKLYLNAVTEDGKAVDTEQKKMVLSPSAHRVDIDIEMINFVHRNVYAGYYLKGMDSRETRTSDLTDKSYTNLKGGNYTYEYKVYDVRSDRCLAELSVSFRKNYKFLEQFRVRVLLVLLAVGSIILLFVLFTGSREKQVKRRYYLEFLKEKEAELSELAYKDPVTGVYNRNYFEQEKGNINLKRLFAFVSVSVNHVQYLKNKYGIFYTEGIIRKGVQIMQSCTEEQIKICRVSENIFYFAFMEPVQLEAYIYDLKEQFKKEGEKEGVPFSFSVGAIYNNEVGKETIDELIDRCDKMRLLDEKHSEAKFIEGKMKML